MAARRAAVPPLLAIFLLAALPLVGWAADTTPADILRQPEQFDGQTVSLAGTITNLRTRVSRRGNAYYTFDLTAGGSAIRERRTSHAASF